MDNKTLTQRAEELERSIKAQVGCYVRVGWVKGANDTPHLIVFIDRKVDENKAEKAIPDYWYGIFVDVEAVYPPGTRPPEPKGLDIHNWVF